MLRRKADVIPAPTPDTAPIPPAQFVNDADDDVNADFEETVESREARKPNIDHLEDALTTLDDGTLVPLFGVGDKIVIERRATILPGSPWLDTATYTVTDIDDVSGDLKLVSDGYGHSAMSNFVKGTAAGYRFKIPSGSSIGKKRRGVKGRGRRKVAAPAPVSSPTPDTTLEKRGRGRPKGSKNRPKDVIDAERRAKATARKAKRDATAKRYEEKRAAAKRAAPKKRRSKIA